MGVFARANSSEAAVRGQRGHHLRALPLGIDPDRRHQLALHVRTPLVQNTIAPRRQNRSLVPAAMMAQGTQVSLKGTRFQCLRPCLYAGSFLTALGMLVLDVSAGC